MIHCLACAAACAALATMSATAHANVLTQWNFNSGAPVFNTATGTLVPAVGAGTATAVGGITHSFASGSANGGSTDPAATDNSGWQTTTYSAQGAGNKTRGVQFAVSTVGLSQVAVSWDQRLSNTSSSYAQFQYSTNGTNFTDFGTPFFGSTGDTWYNNRTVNLGSITGVNNNPNFSFRVVSAFAPSTSAYAAASAYAPAGTWRFDMVTVTAVPEPGTYALLLAGLAAVGWVARRRQG